MSVVRLIRYEIDITRHFGTLPYDSTPFLRPPIFNLLGLTVDHVYKCVFRHQFQIVKKPMKL